MGETAGIGDSGGDTGGAKGEGGCAFEVRATLSSAIATVGIVEWSTSLAGISSASVEFGLDTKYGMSAPVDLGAPSFRTLLLGMKPLHQYHFRVVARSNAALCASRDFALETGISANGVPRPTVTNHGGSSAGGFLLTSFLVGGPAFVLDADGDLVWAYGSGEMGRAALSNDGKYVWYSAVNVAGGGGSMKRVTLDGLEETDFSQEFGDLHHDFTILPDETIAFLVHDGDSDRVMERAPDGTQRSVLALGAALGDVTHTHANSLHHYPSDDTYVVSDLATDAFVKFTRQGDVVWILGGARSDFSGDGASWVAQHGQQLLAPDRMLFFNNGASGDASSAVELSLDLEHGTASRAWHYEAGLHCFIYGDVHRFENGNTLVAFSSVGTLHEVGPDGELVKELSWPLGGAFGYVTALASLYPQGAGSLQGSRE